MKRLLPIAAAALLVVGCSAPDSPPDTSSTVESASSSTKTSTQPASSSSTTSAATTTSDSVPSQKPEPTEQSENDAPAEAAEPYIVECIGIPPGIQSRMSDGSVIYTDYCFEQLGGPEYLEAESWANSPDNPARAAYLEEQERLANIPYADGGTCPAYKCGYGTNSQGERNPSSGELQAVVACDTGFITDPEHCESLEWVRDHSYE